MLLASALLAVAIVAEVMATALLPRTDGFSQPGWTALVLGGYAVAIWLLSEIVKTLPVSVTYAVWAGSGTALVALVGAVWLGEQLDAVKITGLAAIVVGVVLLNLQGGH